jgi:hypothetical protein
MDGVNERKPRPMPIGQLVLSRILLIWQPASLALAASDALRALPIRGAPLALLLVARTAVAALSVAAGIALTNARPGGIAMARASLVVSAAMDVFVLTTSIFPNNRAPGDTPIYVAGALIFYGGWLLYLSRSE